MFKINGIEIREKLYQSDTLSWYRGVQGRNNFPLLIKVLPASITRKKSTAIPTQVGKEFELIKSIQSEYVPQAYSHQQLQAHQILLLEDIGGTLLSELELPLHTDLSLFLRLTHNLVSALENLHAHTLVVGMLTVHSVFYHAEDDRLQIIDLSSAIKNGDRFPSENGGYFPPGATRTQEELFYCSPECLTQGKENIDHRNDLYSLGILLYYLLTGQFPFDGENQLELVHAHTARVHLSAAQVVQSIPTPLSQIIDKLLEKLPEKRYLSCSALKLDIERCIDDFEHYGIITDFQIDETYRLQTAHSPLFGREPQCDELQTAFNRTKNNKRFFVGVSGVSGSGKTALVHHFKQQISAEPHFFLSGKFDQYQQEIPHSSFIEGLKEFTRIILTGDHENLEQWRSKLTAGLKANGQLVIDVIPELEFIIGPQPPVPKLDPAETKARFEICLRRFIQLCSTPGEPLVFFLDDMQWADTATLNLLALFLKDTAIHSLLIIGAYRDNEVQADSPLAGFLNDTASSLHATSQHIHLQDLTPGPLKQYLEYHLPDECDNLDEIAAVCMEKTHGNPFFLQQFLNSLFEQKLIHFDPLAQCWVFKERGASQKRITENVADIILERFYDLSPECKNLLQNLACSGSSFDLGTIHLLTNTVNDVTNAPLNEAVQQGFLLCMGKTPSVHEPGPQHFRFAHDQIQQAIYSQIPSAERQKKHLEIGKRFFQQCSNENLEAHIYPIVYHCNHGSDLIEGEKERNHLAKLNYTAGKKALATTAHKAAKKYFTTAITLLGDEGWDEHNYELCFKLHLHGAEVCYLINDFVEMSRLVETAVARAKSTLDTISLHEIEIQALTAQNRLEEAIEKSLYALHLLGVDLPRKPSRISIFFTYLKIRMYLIGKQTEELLNLPQMEDPHKQAILRILSRTGTPAYYKGAKFLASIALKTVEYSIKYGNASHSAGMGYATFAIMQCGLFGDIKSGYKSGLIALNLQKKFVPNSILPASQYLFANLIQHWKQHLSETLEPIRQAHIVALEIGETEQAGLALYSYNNRLFLLGRNLDSVHTEMVNALQVLQQVGQKIMTFRQRIALQVVSNLRSQQTLADTFSGKYYNEEELIPEHLASGDKTTLFQLYMYKMIQAYLLGGFTAALKAEECAQQYTQSVLSSAFLPHLYYISSLTRLAMFHQASAKEQRAFIKNVQANQKKLKKWARHAPMNFLHLYQLVAAELYRCKGNLEKAEKLYEQAIQNGDQNGFLHNTAMAYELAGYFYLSRDRKVTGEAYLKEACLCFQRWGATAKVHQLLQHYPMLADQDEKITDLLPPLETAFSSETETCQPLSQLDMLTLLKASRVLASKTHSTSYLASMLKIMIENAGAENGLLFLFEEDRWQAKVSGQTVKNTITLTYFSEDDQDPLLPWSVIQYVARTGEKVILTNAALDNTYSRDPYISAVKSKSILCCPILFRGEVVSILFLENNLMINAFSRKQVELIEHLGSQASLSLRNALLYTELRATIDRTQQEIVNHQQTQQQLLHSEKLAAMGKLSASIAHEIGNPLLGLKFLLAEIHKNTPLNPQQETMVKVGLGECLRLQDMIRKLRHLYQTPTYNLEECNFNDIIENTLIFYDKHIQAHNITLDKHLHPALENVMGVKDQLVQVLTNLILNAVDVMPDGGVLSLTTGHCGEDVYFAVGDTGEGISQEDQEKIFEPFYSSKPSVEGAGLGLSVSYGIVAKHEGVLSVHSTPGDGTCFVVSMPKVEQVPIIT